MLLKYFTPARYIRNFKSLDFDWLKRQGIRILVLDVDNTLVAHDEKVANEEVIQFVHQLKEHGLQPVVMSNNNEPRVKLFASSIDVPYYFYSTKPLKRTYRKLLRDYNVKPQQCAVIGDQLLTDVLGGNRMKFTTILTTPLVTRDIPWTKLNRALENQVYKLLEKKHLLKRGKYDD